MKKLFLAMALMLVSATSFAQLKFDVRAGMSAYSITKDDNGKGKVGYTVGVGLDYAFTDMWSFQSGVMFTGKGEKYKLQGSTVKFKPTYLDIPLMAAVKFPIANDVKFVVDAGPYLGIGLGGKITYSDMDITTKYFTDFEAKRFDLGLQYGVGAEFGEHILVNLNGQVGFISPHESYGKNLGMTLSLGYRF